MPVASRLCLALIFVALAPALAPAQTLAVPQTSSPIVLDGRADEAAWESAVALDGFTVYSPDTGIEAAADVVGRVVRTDQGLYIWVDVGVPREDVYAPLSRRDGTSGDYVEVQLDPWGRGVRGYNFRVNARGVLADALIRSSGVKDFAWDSLFDARTEIRDDGWSVEMFVPYQSLRFDPSQNEWGLHVYVRAWEAEQSLSWRPIDRDNQDFFEQAGLIDGMAGARPGRAIEVLPFITLSSQRVGGEPLPPCEIEGDIFSDRGCGSEVDYGVGFKWGATPWLTLDAVFNPDFSQVEADDAQLSVNNRFALFLSERRPFFLEGRDIFEGPLGSTYTRAINQPDVAAKVSGQLEHGRFGTLVAFDRAPPDSVLDSAFSTSEHGDSGTRSLTTISRAVWDATDDDAFGLTLTSKQWLGDGDGTVAHNVVASLDAETRLAEHVWLEASAAVSTSEGFEGTDLTGAAARTRATWQSDAFRIFGTYEGYSDEYRAEAGFVSRVDYHSAFVKADYYYRSDNNWGRFVSPGWWGRTIFDGRGDLVDSTLGTNVYWEFGHHVWAFAEYERIGERYFEGGARAGVEDQGEWFDADAVYVSAGSETLGWLEVSSSISIRDTIIRDPSLRREGEDAFLGSQLTPSGTLTLRPTPSLRWSTTARSRMISRGLGQAQLTTQPILRSGLEYFPTRALELRAIAEWQARDDALSTDLLFGWTPSPGNVVYLGFREETALAGPGAELDRRTFFIKFSRLFVR